LGQSKHPSCITIFANAANSASADRNPAVKESGYLADHMGCRSCSPNPQPHSPPSGATTGSIARPGGSVPFSEVLGAITTIGAMSTIIAFFAGAPVFLILKYFNPNLPAWTILPIGLATVGAWILWASQRK